MLAVLFFGVLAAAQPIADFGNRSSDRQRRRRDRKPPLTPNRAQRLNDLLEFGDGDRGGGKAVVSAKDGMKADDAGRSFRSVKPVVETYRPRLVAVLLSMFASSAQFALISTFRPLFPCPFGV